MTVRVQNSGSGVQIRRVFPGGNTCVGFFSFYDQIIDQNATRILIIKGGPGVGKSTFMRRIADRMLQEGYSVEYHQCSSDNDSIDGVVLPEIGVALIDGTAPHVVDPKTPGCVDEIIHLGDFWNESGLRKVRGEIIARNRKVAEHFESAYRYLRAAKHVHDEWEDVNGRHVNRGKLNVLTASLAEEYLGPGKVSDRPGSERHLFLAAITPDGVRNYHDTVLGGVSRRVILRGEPGIGKSTILQRLGRRAVEYGLRTEFFHCPFDPGKIEHVVLAELDLAFMSWGELYPLKTRGTDLVIDLNESTGLDGAGADVSERETAKQMFFKLLGIAISRIAEAKAVHDEIEDFYVPNMDFARIEQLKEDVIDRILSYRFEKEVCKSTEYVQ